jgi:hypothetical protein
MLDENTPPWPQKDDKLFIEGDDWYYVACLNDRRDNLGLYIVGYKEAGDVLVKHVMQTRRHHDSLVFPIVFMYRHYLELRLKQLIQDGNLFLGNPSIFPKHHQIDRLWRECKAILKQVEPKMPDQDLEAIEERINEFSTTDPGSMAFRYPIDKDNNPSLPGLSHINVRNLAEVMEKLAAFLDSASIAISVYLDKKREIESAYQDSYGDIT